MTNRCISKDLLMLILKPGFNVYVTDSGNILSFRTDKLYPKQI